MVLEVKKNSQQVKSGGNDTPAQLLYSHPMTVLPCQLGSVPQRRWTCASDKM